MSSGRISKRGIWKHGLRRESAAEYKKKYGSSDPSTPVLVKAKRSSGQAADVDTVAPAGGVLRRLLG